MKAACLMETAKKKKKQEKKKINASVSNQVMKNRGTATPLVGLAKDPIMPPMFVGLYNGNKYYEYLVKI